MRTQSSDTSPEAERVQIELIRKASSAKLFGIVRSFTQSLMFASRQNIRKLHPELNQDELNLLFVELYYGKELAEQVKEYLERRKWQ
jgi:hypothetical protein